MSNKEELENIGQLRVVRAAMKDDKGNIYSLPPPRRHHNIIVKMRNSGYAGSLSSEKFQGFILSNGDFVDRYVAYEVAKEAKQLIRGEISGGRLTSEDVW